MATVFELKEKMAILGAAIAADAAWIAEKAAGPETPMDDILEKKRHRDEVQARFDMIREEHDTLERKAKLALQDQQKQQQAENGDPNVSKLKAKGEFYKTALTGGNVGSVVKDFQGLGAIPAGNDDLGHGDNLLPTTMSNELITEPYETNSLRTIEQVSQITGLEEPRLLFDIEDEKLEDVTDKETAREIETKGDTVSYGRFKTKISVTVKDTVLHGSPLNLAAEIEKGLRSGLAIKEKMRAFAVSSDEVHKHMSYYHNGIKVIERDNLITGIIDAYGDLSDIYAENAKVIMRRSDYYSAIRELVNGSDTLFGKKPEDVIGIPVIFNDRAVKPVVGDFNYSKQNYDIGTIYETDKDGKKGEYYFILTAWGDHKIKLSSAFRVVEVSENP